MKKSSARHDLPPFEESGNLPKEKTDTWWYRIYLAVVVTTILMISTLWAFSLYFSK